MWRQLRLQYQFHIQMPVLPQNPKTNPETKTRQDNQSQTCIAMIDLVDLVKSSDRFG